MIDVSQHGDDRWPRTLIDHLARLKLLDDFLLLDAGTIGLALEKKAQNKISHILITHAHLDHIKGIPFLIDNITTNGFEHQVTVISGKDVLLDLKENIFNDRIWPDFSVIPDRRHPVMKYQELSARGHLQIRDYRVYATGVNHTVASYGYIIEDPHGNAVVYTGDTGPTESLWKKMNQHNAGVLICEVSFPDSMKGLALKTGHLTPSLLGEEMKKMSGVPERIYITHVKPQ